MCLLHDELINANKEIDTLLRRNPHIKIIIHGELNSGVGIASSCHKQSAGLRPRIGLL